MADPVPAAAAPGAAGANANANDDNGGFSWIKSIFRSLMWAWLLSNLMKMFSGQPEAAANLAKTGQPAGAGDSLADKLAAATGMGTLPTASGADLSASVYSSPEKFQNLWGTDSLLDLYVYLGDSLATTPTLFTSPAVWRHRFTYGDWSASANTTLSIPLSDAITAHNASLFAHVYVAKAGVSPDPASATFVEADVIARVHPLVQYRPPKRVSRRKKLLAAAAASDSNDAAEPEQPAEVPEQADAAADAPYIGYWSGNVTVNVVPDRIDVVPKNLPPFINEWVDYDEATKTYKPITWINQFWVLEDDLVPITPGLTHLPLRIDYAPMSLMKFQMTTTIDSSLKMQAAALGGARSELDEVKRMLRDTNPWLLGMTMGVSMLHSLFEFLAFKNEVQFWKGKKSVKGISVRSMLVNLGIQVIIFLYLLDNQTNTSYVILVSNGIGLAIEAWKVTRALNTRVDHSRKILGIFPTVSFSDKASYAKSRTKEYDEQAFRYLQWVAYPCLAGYVVYSLVYEEHKGWYSFVLSTLVGFVYTFSFLQSTPQLFINYKLKSVANMNGRTLAYKFLNTIVDDLFAFVIKMPTWHRIAVFRDDIIFVVFMIQRYLYRVDHSRVNEFGQGGNGGEEEEEDDDEDAAERPKDAAAAIAQAPALSPEEKKNQ
ncbi:hypothetical protein AMAG_15960 [Allomyces macrogynus ATCC 38327]|uniref:Cleft lip and palate transmembrane protein 1 n=1 Tax=Allomyces macrogynus (strain ATCC 38327) TaxID=578462 RepID=A0A0L0TB60_ALLM3|nr:hypothetical protein AMAG_15960 [Allomyces macrogynus ATCC 38327]|eukprot:KNE72018.1 hypothetical protein AMAG_15960 [Allomyces macrogynus ATCC 38327]